MKNECAPPNHDQKVWLLLKSVITYHSLFFNNKRLRINLIHLAMIYMNNVIRVHVSVILLSTYTTKIRWNYIKLTYLKTLQFLDFSAQPSRWRFCKFSALIWSPSFACNPISSATFPSSESPSLCVFCVSGCSKFNFIFHKCSALVKIQAKDNRPTTLLDCWPLATWQSIHSKHAPFPENQVA